jgi:hypothetical protein
VKLCATCRYYREGWCYGHHTPTAPDMACDYWRERAAREWWRKEDEDARL